MSYFEDLMKEMEDESFNFSKWYSRHNESRHFHDIREKNGNAVCETCGEVFGPHCEKSEDHVCHFEMKITDIGCGQVELHNGSIFLFFEPEKMKVDGKTCLFCGRVRED